MFKNPLLIRHIFWSRYQNLYECEHAKTHIFSTVKFDLKGYTMKRLRDFLL